MRSRDYDRTMRHPTLVEGSGYARDALHDVVQSMSALAWMTRCLLLVDAEEAAGPTLAEGVHKLFDQQCAMLNGIFEELGVEEERRAAEDEARGIVRQSRVPTDALMEPAHKLRVAFIESNTRDGVEPGLIQAALNLADGDVQRVIARLRGEAKPGGGREAKRA